MLPFLYLCAMPDSVLLHMRFILRKRNITVLRDSFSRYYGRHLRVSFNDGLYRRVRQGELRQRRKRRCPGVRPRRTASNDWHNLSRRGAQCAPTQRKIERVAGAQCAPLRYTMCRWFTRCAEVGAPYGRAYAIPKTFRNNGNDSTIATKRRPMILRSAFCFI